LTTVVSHQRLPSALLPSIADRASLRNTHILLLLVIAVRTLASGLTLISKPFSGGEQCTTGALLAPTQAGGAAGVVADIAKLSVGREAYYTRELATDHQQYLSDHGESPGRWYGAGATSLGLGGEASPVGFQAMFEGRHPTPGDCWAARTAATPCPPSTWSCGRPRASRSSTASVTRPPAEPCWPPITPGWPRRSATWTSTWAPAAATVATSTCPDRGC
jgi:hypothetical protein